MVQIDTIVFDLDGTLADASRDITNAVNFILAGLGRPGIPVEVVASYIGGGAEVLWRKILKEEADELLPSVLPKFLQRYNEYYCVETVLYPGVMDVLSTLQKAGFKMGIATQKVEKITFGILDSLGIRSFFPVVVGPESITHRKPHPESVIKILDYLGSQPGQAWMVGDAPADILAGKAAGTGTVGVSYGYGQVEEILSAGPDAMIDRLPDLLDLLYPVSSLSSGQDTGR